jgi:Kelch motif protein
LLLIGLIAPLRTAGVAALLAALLGALLAGCSFGTSTTALPVSAPAASGVTGWQTGPDATLALTEVAVAAHQGRIWVAGGLDESGKAVDRVLVFDPETGRWQDGPLLAGPVHHAALVSDGHVLWLIGGYASDAFDRPTNAVRRLEGDTWGEAAPLPEPRAAGAAAWDGGRIVYAGGVGSGGASADVFSLNGDGWHMIGRLSEAREHLAAASDGAGTVYALGGRRGGLDGNLGTADLIDGAGVRRLGDMPTPRGGVAAFFWPSLGACLVGGESVGGTNAQVECVTHDGRLVSLPNLTNARHGLGAVVIARTAYVVLGGPRPGLFASRTLEQLRLP